VLSTERLVLRPWRVSDAAVHRELWLERDPRVPPHRRIDADGNPTVDELADRIRTGSTRLLVVELAGSGEMIGYCGLIDLPERTELAYELLRRHWGQGYATEAARAVLETATERRITAGVRAWNTASLRVLEKLGFTPESVDPDPEHGDSVLLVLER